VIHWHQYLIMSPSSEKAGPWGNESGIFSAQTWVY
jgi:hypothetical protein